MEKQKVNIQSIKQVNHNVLRIRTEKPKEINFKPGQAVSLCLDKDDWREEERPFTFTSLPSDDYLEFHIKVYPSHDGVTEQLYNLTIKDKFILGDVFGAIKYKGKGTFIAGGAGLTPFLAIFKDLQTKNELADNVLFFANKTKKDIFLQDWLDKTLGDNFRNILSEEDKKEYSYGRIDKDFLKENITDFSQKFYVCGPPKMQESIIDDLLDLGVDKNNIVAEDLDS